MTDVPITKLRVWTEKDLEIFDCLQTPMWVFDFEFPGKWWANRAGLLLWKADSVEHMRERGRGTPVSEATKLRQATMRDCLTRGETMKDRWTYYPTGHAPFVAEVIFSAICIANAAGAEPRLAMLAEARPIGENEMDPFYRRGMEVLRHMGEMVSLYKPNGELLMRNPAAVSVFGDGADAQPGTDLLAQIFISSSDAKSIVTDVENGPIQKIVEVNTKNGLAWHAIEVRKTTDPVTGDLAILMNHRDISDRVRAEQELAESREKLALQAEQLRQLAASPLRIWKGILALPLIGRIDEARIQSGLQGIQSRSNREQIKVVLLDLTGAEVVDADAADAIRRLIRSLSLQGIASRVVGVRATLARTLVGEGIDLGSVPIHASLADALARELHK